MATNNKQYRTSFDQGREGKVGMEENQLIQEVERQREEGPIITIQEVKSMTSIDQNYQMQEADEEKNVQPTTYQQPAQQHPHQPPNNTPPLPSTSSINADFPHPTPFQVIIHKVNSQQSLHDDNHLIQFTKSQLQIPLHLDNQQEQTQKPQTTEYVNIWKKDDPQIDQMYVKMMEDNWTKSQEERSSVRKPLSHVEQVKQVETQAQGFGLFNLLQQLSKVPDQNVTTPISNKNETINNKKQTINNKNEVANNKNQIANNKNEKIFKKPYFKIKKLKQAASGGSTLHNRDFSLKNSKQTKRHQQNQSQFIELKKQKSPIIFQRLSKKKLSNFSATKNIPPIPKISARKVPQNVKYEVIVGNQGETMNRILEDRSYNFLIGPTIRRDHSHPIILNFKQTEFKSTNSTQVPIKTIRKVIKSSPYGLLQLEVKDTNNQAKITNLRILKPKDMIKLKKIPKTVKNFKQSVIVS